mmetsp:Transcript_134027/g.199353  ORF Transcript_134027/g.199353 Transcript_134027/m.199353 type:complete len:217 (+) Transcript_134027:487-1137(+)
MQKTIQIASEHPPRAIGMGLALAKDKGERQHEKSLLHRRVLVRRMNGLGVCTTMIVVLGGSVDDVVSVLEPFWRAFLFFEVLRNSFEFKTKDVVKSICRFLEGDRRDAVVGDSGLLGDLEAVNRLTLQSLHQNQTGNRGQRLFTSGRVHAVEVSSIRRSFWRDILRHLRNLLGEHELISSHIFLGVIVFLLLGRLSASSRTWAFFLLLQLAVSTAL